MSAKLWIGSGTLFASLFIMKQYIFHEVSSQVTSHINNFILFPVPLFHEGERH